MSANETHELFSLLTEEGKALDNLKFFPGDKCRTRGDLLNAAANMARDQLDTTESTPFPDADLRSAYVVEL